MAKIQNAVPAAPRWMAGSLSDRWNDLAPIAVMKGTLSESTADAFARYIVAENQYLQAVQRVLNALQTGNTDAAKDWSSVQDRFFKEMESSGKAFGLAPGAF